MYARHDAILDRYMLKRDAFKEDVSKDRKPKRQSEGLRWKRILHKVGWMRIPSEAEDEENWAMRDMGRRGAVVDIEAEEARAAEQSVATEPELGTRPKTAKGKKPTRSNDVPSFENLGGYRYGDYSYGRDNMSPLPVRNAPSPTPYNQLAGPVEVEGMSIASGSPTPTSLPDSSRDSMDSGYGQWVDVPLTFHNGYPTCGRHGMMAALPIPTDHPLSQHRIIEQSTTSANIAPPRPRAQPLRQKEIHDIERHLEEEDDISLKEEDILKTEHNLQEEERILTSPEFQAARKGSPSPYQYERESLVPAPLNLRRGRYSPDPPRNSNQRPDRTSTPEAQQGNIAELESPPSVPSRRRSDDPGFRSSTSTSESRYSHLENPLGQHPVELDDTVRNPQDPSRPGTAKPAGSDSAEQEWPLGPRVRRKRYTWAVERTPLSAIEAHPAQCQA